MTLPRGVRWLIEALAAGALLACCVVPAWFWSRLPESIPTHFDFAGSPDAWGPKALVLVVPALCVLVYTLLTLADWCPQLVNFRFTGPHQRERDMVGCAKMLVMVMFAMLEWAIVQFAMDAHVWAPVAAHCVQLKVAEAAMGAQDGVGTASGPAVLLIVLGTAAWYLVRVALE